MQDRGYGLLRIHLPRRWVNKGEKKVRARRGLVDRGKLDAQLLPGLTYDRIVAIILALEPAGGLDQDPVHVAAVTDLDGEDHPQQQQPVAL
jgi:hypothetical protein